MPSRRDLPRFDGSAVLKIELLNWFPGSLLPDENIAANFPMLSVPEMNLTSSFLFSSDQLEYALHLLLSLVSLQHVSREQLVFEMIYNPLDLVYTVVKPAFFVILNLQDPSLQCFPLSHNIGMHLGLEGRTSLHQLFQIHPHLQ